MAVSIQRENFVWHKLHSLTGVVPVGYYMVQHLVLNAFSLGGPAKFDAVIDFFDGMPRWFLLTIEISLIWAPLLFHAIYGLFIVDRSKPNYFGTKYKWSQNRMYTMQRWSGIFLFVFLLYHSLENTGSKYLTGDSNVVKFAAWHTQLTSHYYLWFVFYMVGVLVASYHLCYGLWNFCIRWGITISEGAQERVQKLSGVAFIALTLLGWFALAGFIRGDGSSTTPTETQQSQPGAAPVGV
jgi:succinate dehydrogenase / fumarate reductase cytochrome b subunit